MISVLISEWFLLHARESRRPQIAMASLSVSAGCSEGETAIITYLSDERKE